jgi:hypothetical protein
MDGNEIFGVGRRGASIKPKPCRPEALSTGSLAD